MLRFIPIHRAHPPFSQNNFCTLRISFQLLCFSPFHRQLAVTDWPEKLLFLFLESPFQTFQVFLLAACFNATPRRFHSETRFPFFSAPWWILPSKTPLASLQTSQMFPCFLQGIWKSVIVLRFPETLLRTASQHPLLTFPTHFEKQALLKFLFS